jgi:hypothetical protein
MAEIDLDQGIWDEFEDYSGPIQDLNYDLEWDDSEEGEFGLSIRYRLLL